MERSIEAASLPAVAPSFVATSFDVGPRGRARRRSRGRRAARIPDRSPASRSRSRICSTSPARSRPPARPSSPATARDGRRPGRAAPAPGRRGADRPNPHVGVRVLRRRPQSAPSGPRQRRRRSALDPVARIPGGSTSGGASSVAGGAAWAALGSDTGGSIRIPAALQGLVGFKSTASLVPTTGAIPLSTTLDTVSRDHALGARRGRAARGPRRSRASLSRVARSPR